jgi:hypothetical protein
MTKRCVSGLNCVGVMTSMGMVVTEGTCRASKTKAGEPCDRTNRVDVTCSGTVGLYCHHEMETDPATGMPRAAATGTCKKIGFAMTGGVCGTLMDGSSVTCQGGDACQRMTDPLTGNPITNMPGTCVADVGEGKPCNTNGDIGPGCLPGHTCVLTNPGISTAGTCRKRVYETLCMKK